MRELAENGIAIEADNAACYASHKWKSERQMTDYGTGTEYVCVCSECGTENQGDPAEFPDVQYQMCAEELHYLIATDRVETQPTFDDLRRMAQHARMRPLIEQRKDRIAPAPWKFEPDSRYHRDHDTLLMCNRLTEIFAEPDGITPLQNWLRILLEDAFVLGGTSVYVHRGSEKVFFRLMDFASVGLIRDQHGNPSPLGAPFAAQMVGEEPLLLTVTELLYAVRHPREGMVYGESKLEQVAALEYAESQNLLKESKDGAMFRIFEPLIGPVEDDREWVATQVIDKLVERVFGETHCKFRWKVD